MTAYVALLRAVNVGGTGKLSMATLRAACEDAGFRSIRTYIASGNVVFAADEGEAAVRAALEDRLSARAGQSMTALVRTGGELAELLARNPFPDAPRNQVIVTLTDGPVSAASIEAATGVGVESLRPGDRAIYVFYPSGVGASRLKIPAARSGTGRNVNTLARLAAMAAEIA
jgi:uncharacterized protein (DUF1697 family)